MRTALDMKRKKAGSLTPAGPEPRENLFLISIGIESLESKQKIRHY